MTEVIQARCLAFRVLLKASVRRTRSGVTERARAATWGKEEPLVQSALQEGRQRRFELGSLLCVTFPDHQNVPPNVPQPAIILAVTLTISFEFWHPVI